MATATKPARRPSAGAVPGRWGACLAVRTPPAALFLIPVGRFCKPPVNAGRFAKGSYPRLRLPLVMALAVGGRAPESHGPKIVARHQDLAVRRKRHAADQALMTAKRK